MATGGASKYGKVVPELEKRFGKWDSKPSLSEHMAGEIYPKVDANDLLQSNPEELVQRLLNGLEKSYEELPKQKAANEERRQAMTESKREENKIGIENFFVYGLFCWRIFPRHRIDGKIFGAQDGL